MTIDIDDPNNFMQISQDAKFAAEFNGYKTEDPSRTIEESARLMGYSPNERFRENARRAKR